MATPSRSISALLLVAASLGGCASVLAPAAFEGGAPEFRPEVFFSGRTSSTGVLENRSGAPTGRFQVDGHGQTLRDGTFRLEQAVGFDQKPPEQRTWSMHRIDDHRYEASLTDASGPVHAEAYGNLFHLRYPMKTPFGGRMEQWMYLQPDGCTVLNEATVRVFGVVVARLSERITREDGQRTAQVDPMAASAPSTPACPAR